MEGIGSPDAVPVPKAAWVADGETVQAVRVQTRPGSPVPFPRFSPDLPPTPETPPPMEAWADARMEEQADSGPGASAASPTRPSAAPRPAYAQALWQATGQPNIRRRVPPPPVPKEMRLAQREWRDGQQLLAQRAELLSRDLPAAAGSVGGQRADAQLTEALLEVAADAEQVSSCTALLLYYYTSILLYY